MITIILLNILVLCKILLLSWVITRFEPIEEIFEYITPKDPTMIAITLAIHKLLTCYRCCSLWVGLIVFGNIWMALLACLIAFIYDKFFAAWETRIKLN